MVDGDQLNVVVDPLFVSIAERNIKKYDVTPLFYDAIKTETEMVTKEAMFQALKRAHDYSAGEITSIGEISNMLTRLWNKDKPDRDAANLLCMFNNWVIDAAKVGHINHYKNYPKAAKKIGKATGGKNGRMPYFYAWSKNQRHSGKNKNKKYAEPNNSTMNRICRAFDDIGNINLNYAGILQFNYQMLLPGPCMYSRIDIGEMFCELDSSNVIAKIKAQDAAYMNERVLIYDYNMVAEDIKNRLTDKFGPLEEIYPYIVEYLFAGEGINKPAHKQMFWRVFGDIALENLKNNLVNCDTCKDCQMKIPGWVRNHQCIKNTKGFFECINCHTIQERKNSKQCRCEECQKNFAIDQKKEKQRIRREIQKEIFEKRTSHLQLFSTET